MQLMMNEVVVYGMLTISVLYKGFELSWKNGLYNDIALSHYNYALRLVATGKLQDGIVLVASVLFICIEFLCGNEGAAITHCWHGI
jgi:hypothetical protein